jgi:hypothetical protein
MKCLLPNGYITMGELCERIAHRYRRQWLSRLASTGKIPGAEPRPPSGKQWMFKDSPNLREWVSDQLQFRVFGEATFDFGETKVIRYHLERKRGKDPRRETFVTFLAKIESWFRDQPPLDEWTPERRAYCASKLFGLVRIYAQLAAKATTFPPA